ncbi:hypothetical protein [Glacieibacterium frigidum]|uniref:Uncharacterized protein n=1 Tax=Glacieibacterium frigidum TaxID=2593303 RepID=A0A552UJ96_9SPHN|nr:hypothetical protein [Glacieibacterium frigidum]TRW18297.1 hypothetical protein FMM06_09450 [Glacieibacterium frigidum]
MIRPAPLLCLALLFGAVVAPVSAQPVEELHLACYGSGEKQVSSFSNDYYWDRRDGRYRSRDGIENTTRNFETAVSIDIADGQGRIRLAKTVIPPLNNGGEGDGWWRLDAISVTPDEIRASYKLNGLNHPKVRIDRRSGAITMSGLNIDFTGRCDAMDRDARRF